MTRITRIPFLGSTIALGLVLAGCTATATPIPTPTRTAVDSAPPAPAVSAPLPSGTPTELAAEITTPWSVVFAGDTPLISSRDTAEVLEVVGATTRLVGTVPGVVQMATAIPAPAMTA